MAKKNIIYILLFIFIQIPIFIAINHKKNFGQQEIKAKDSIESIFTLNEGAFDCFDLNQNKKIGNILVTTSANKICLNIKSEPYNFTSITGNNKQFSKCEFNEIEFSEIVIRNRELYFSQQESCLFLLIPIVEKFNIYIPDERIRKTDVSFVLVIHDLEYFNHITSSDIDPYINILGGYEDSRYACYFHYEK